MIQRPPNLCTLLVLIFTLGVIGCGSNSKKDKSTATKDSLKKDNGKTQPKTKDKTKGAAFLVKRPVKEDIKTALRFTDRTAETGISFTYRNGKEAGELTMLETLGGGVALVDYDLDGWPDVFATGGGTIGKDKSITGLPSALYRNLGSLKFEAVTTESSVGASRHYTHGAYALDHNSDGFPDLLVTGFGGLMLYENQGDGTFLEVTSQAGLKDTSWSVAAAWGDVNGDGAIDIYVSHYLDWSFANHPFCRGRDESLVPSDQTRRDTCAPRIFKPLADTLYLGNGDGTFRDGTQEAKLSAGGRGLGALMADLDQDGRLDIYVCNDTDANFLWHNQGNGVFKDLGLLSGACHDDVGNTDGSMGVDVGDYNLDGRLDIWVTNFQGEQFALYENQGNARFIHVSNSRGMLTFPDVYVGWGTMFFDVDADGDEEIFVTNGHVQAYPIDTTVRQKPLLLENLNGKRFVDVTLATEVPYLSTAHEGRGVAAGDLDGDGDLDLVVTHVNAPLTVLSNETEHKNHWLQLALHGTESSRDPVGAQIDVKVGERTLVRQVKTGSSYLSTLDRRIHFGLGDAASVDYIQVTWPSGRVERFQADLDKRQQLVEGTGEPVPKQ